MDLKNLFSKKSKDANAEPKTIKDYIGLIVATCLIIIFLLIYFFLIRPTFVFAQHFVFRGTFVFRPGLLGLSTRGTFVFAHLFVSPNFCVRPTCFSRNFFVRPGLLGLSTRRAAAPGT